MDELPYALSEEDFVRMSNAVRRVEGLPPRRDSQAIYRAAPEGNAHAWIKVTSSTASTITLGGGTVTGYAAVWGFFDSGATGFTFTTNTAWFVPQPGGGAPTVAQIFECRLLGADTSGVPIWGAVTPSAQQIPTVIQIQSSSSTTVTLVGGATIQAFSAKIMAWNNATPGWTATATTCWFYPLDLSKTPPVNQNILTQFAVNDNSGEGIYVQDIFEQWALGSHPVSSFTFGSISSAQNITGFTLTLTAAGTWAIFGLVTGTFTASSVGTPGPPSVGIALSITPTPTTTYNTGTTWFGSAQVASVAILGSCPIFSVIQAVASTSVQVQLVGNNGGNVSSGTVYGTAGNLGSSYIMAKRIF